MRNKIITSSVVIMLSLAVGIFILKDQAHSPASQDPPEISDPVQTKDNEFPKSKYSLTDPASLWVIVNKQNSIPTDYVPADLVIPDVLLRLSAQNEQMKISEQMHEAVKQMFAAASDDGVELVFGSGYRSADLQKQFYDSYVLRDGQDAADRYSARPGHSEHQTGLSFDVTARDGACHLEKCFEDTPEGTWVKENAHKYGFIIRYPEGLEEITGYDYEPWHLRYVGVELAAEMNKENIQTLEQFFSVAGGTSY